MDGLMVASVSLPIDKGSIRGYARGDIPRPWLFKCINTIPFVSGARGTRWLLLVAFDLLGVSMA